MVETIVRWLALGALLPVTAATHRVIAFLIAGKVPSLIAASLPVPQLTVLGAQLLLPGLVIGSLAALYFHAPPKLPSVPVPSVRLDPPTLAKIQNQLARPFVRLGVVLVITGILSLLIARYLFPGVTSLLLQSRGLGNLLSNIVAAGIVYWGFELGRGVERVPYRRLIPIVLTLMVTVAISSSLGPTTAGTFVAEVHFFPPVPLQDGNYSVLGGDEGETWLLACTPGAAPTRVRAESIASLTVLRFGASPRIPTIEESLRTNAWVAGYLPMCPN